jgi:hypothetical protein
MGHGLSPRNGRFLGSWSTGSGPSRSYHTTKDLSKKSDILQIQIKLLVQQYVNMYALNKLMRRECLMHGFQIRRQKVFFVITEKDWFIFRFELLLTETLPTWSYALTGKEKQEKKIQV